MITATERAQRMVESSPEYYHYSRVYNGIQQAVADDLDLVAAGNDDLAAQLRATTATWGLKYWERRVGLPIDEASSYEFRRKKVLARIRSKAPFSAAMVKAVAEAYLEHPVTIEFSKADLEVIIVMDHETTTSAELFAAIDNIIHAHLGVEYRAHWQYSGPIEYSWTYTAWNYPYLTFASPQLLTGTRYDGQRVRQEVVYDHTEELAASFEKTTQTYPQSSTKVAGDSAAPGTQNAAYAATAEGVQEFGKVTNTYHTAGTINAGTGVTT